MGCGGSTATTNAYYNQSAPAKEEPVVAFKPEETEEDDDDIGITQPTTTKPAEGRNPKSAIQFAQAPTEEETKAAIERSMQLNPTPQKENNEVLAFDEDPVKEEHSPAHSPRARSAGGSEPARSDTPPHVSASLRKLLQEKPATADKAERKHYFPESSPTWDVVGDDKDRSPMWTDGQQAQAGGGEKKKDSLFPTIAPRPQAVARSNSQDELTKGTHLPSIYGTDGKPEPVQLAIVALEQKKMREEHEKNMGSLAYLENWRNKQNNNATSLGD